MLSRDEFHSRFQQYFGFVPTESQRETMEHLSDFIYEKGERYLFILKGYAGTGKTTLVSALIKTLEDVHVRTVVLAPTGRAAKVISQYAGKKAYTIHKWIYRIATRNSLRQFVRRENKFTHTLFIVDEASMISASSAAGEIPGMGSLSMEAIVARDYAVFMGILALTSILGLLGNIISDFCYVLIDPRISLK